MTNGAEELQASFRAFVAGRKDAQHKKEHYITEVFDKS